MNVRCKVVLVSLCILIIDATADEVIPPAQGNFLRLTSLTEFEMQGWEGEYVFKNAPANKDRLELKQIVVASVQKTNDYRPRWKFDENLSLQIDKNIEDNYNVVISADVNYFYDQRARIYRTSEFQGEIQPYSQAIQSNSTLFIQSIDNDLKTFSVRMGSGYSPSEKLNINVTLGPIYEKRNNDRQTGMRYKAQVDWQDYLGDISSNAWVDDLTSTNNYGTEVSFIGQQDLAGGAVDQLMIRWLKQEQQEPNYYNTVDAKRLDETIMLRNRLFTATEADWDFAWEANVQNKKSVQSSEQGEYVNKDFVWKNDLSFDMEFANFTSVLFGGVDFQHQQYDGSPLTGRLVSINMQGRRTKLGFNLGYQPQFADSIHFESAVSNYKFDTLEESDQNDRDELSYHNALRSGWRIAPTLRLLWRFETDLRHLVYLFGSRSGENRWNRIFRLITEVRWSNDALSNNARFALVSNYTVYDYEPFNETQSRVFRSFNASDSLNLYLSKDFRLNINVVYTLEDNGRLRWEEWMQDIAESGWGLNTMLLPEWKHLNGTYALGFRWSKKQTDIHWAGKREPNEDVTVIGPVARMSIDFNQKSRFELTANYSYVKDVRRGNVNIPNVRSDFVWYLQ